VKKKVPEKEIVVYDGCCPIHDVLRGTSVSRVKQRAPDAVVIAHPECREDVVQIADEVCSTTAMIAAVARHPSARTFIVATEHGILHQLRTRYPGKEFVMADGCVGCRMHCPYMKMVDLVMLRESLARGKHEITVPDDIAAGARRSLERMIAVPRDAESTPGCPS
jgi:quinolinate synthase